jgi:hypothetical protein
MLRRLRRRIHRRCVPQADLDEHVEEIRQFYQGEFDAYVKEREERTPLPVVPVLSDTQRAPLGQFGFGGWLNDR